MTTYSQIFPRAAQDMNRLDYLNDWLTTHNQYNKVDLNEPRAHCCLSALLEESQGQYAPVCEGYATALKVFMRPERDSLRSGKRDYRQRRTHVEPCADGRWKMVCGRCHLE